jgi:hypothetical protein
LSRRVPADRLHHDPIDALRLAMDPPTFEPRVHAAGPADSTAGPPDPVAGQPEG